MKRAILLAGAMLLAGTSEAPGQENRPTPLGGANVPGFAVKTLEAKTFRQLHRAVAPSGPGERWTEIPWQTDLQTARQEAARQKKPLLMWIMDGHPLGCT